MFGRGAAVLLPDPDGASPRPRAPGDVALDAPRAGRRALDASSTTSGRARAPTPCPARASCVPLRSGRESFGVLVHRGGLRRAASGTSSATCSRPSPARSRSRSRARASPSRPQSAAVRARTEELRSSLLSAVSHDLRTPLAAITGAASALRDEAAGTDARERGRAARHHRRGGRAARAAGRQPARHDAARVGRARAASASGCRSRRSWAPRSRRLEAAARRAARSRPSCPRTCRSLSVDPVLLEQLLRQPARERRQAHAAGLAASRSARAPPRRALELEVADRGPGHPPGEEARIFEKFYRGARTQRRRRRPRPRHLPRHRRGARRHDPRREPAAAAARCSALALPLAGRRRRRRAARRSAR